MEKLLREYTEILNGDALASDKFWVLEERIQQGKRNPGMLITEMSRSKMRTNLLCLLDCEVLTPKDLSGFSDELREDLLRVLKRREKEIDINE